MIQVRQPYQLSKAIIMNNDNNSLAHTKWNCKYHIHMLVRIPPKYSVSQIVGYLKGTSSLMIFDKFANLKYKYGNRHFWCRGYYVDTVGKNTKKIKEYIRTQLQEDIVSDQNKYEGIHRSFHGKKEVTL